MRDRSDNSRGGNILGGKYTPIAIIFKLLIRLLMRIEEQLRWIDGGWLWGDALVDKAATGSNPLDETIEKLRRLEIVSIDSRDRQRDGLL